MTEELVEYLSVSLNYKESEIYFKDRGIRRAIIVYFPQHNALRKNNEWIYLSVKLITAWDFWVLRVLLSYLWFEWGTIQNQWLSLLGIHSRTV